MDTATIEMILVIISLIGMALVSRHESRLTGFLVCSIGNLGWILHGISISHTPYIILFLGYLPFNLIGLHDEYHIKKRVDDYAKEFNLK